MATRNYNCKESELYTICRLGWQSCQQHLPVFSSFKTKYTAAYVDACIAETAAAEALAGNNLRKANTGIFHIELQQAEGNGRWRWQQLKRYITEAYPEQFHKPKLEAAGQLYYTGAGKKDWESVQALLTYGINFIMANQAALQAGGNMPPAFLHILKDAKTDFQNTHQQFLNSEETATIEANAKKEANNSSYKKLISMFLDGQEIFNKNQAVASQFIFSHCLTLVRGSGTAGFKGKLTDAVTGLPIVGALISVKGSDKKAITGKHGKYSIAEIAAGTYSVTFTAEGYQSTTIGHIVKAGAVSNLNQPLTKS